MPEWIQASNPRDRKPGKEYDPLLGTLAYLSISRRVTVASHFQILILLTHGAPYLNHVTLWMFIGSVVAAQARVKANSLAP